MSNQPIKPKYLSSSPSGEDLFEGRSHEKISNTLFDLIKQKALPNNVVGLEGKWGAGKSNVVSILNKKFVNSKTDYVFFTYDAWGHQEDLTRKTFLEELISSLDKDKKFRGDIDWQEELKKLLAKKSTKNTAKFPKIKFYWILFMASFLLFSFLNIIYDDFLAGRDFIEGKPFPFLKPFVSKYLLPIPIFLWGLFELRSEYRSFNNSSETKSLNYRQRLMRLLYVFSGSDLESEELEHVIEEEPSVKRFKEYFEKITKDLKAEGLVIVFDNMDRLSNSEKVLSLWSSIHTFFAEEKVDNVWVIIPYDKQHLSQHFDSRDIEDHKKVENFIGKTFSTIFRISPPVLSDWKRFFTLKFKEAFQDMVEKEDIEFISSLYEMVIDVNSRKPRDIITFINNLVSLYLQHNSSIDIKYLALYALRCNKILDNPLIAISNKAFLDEEKHLFRDETELEKSLAALVYNVDKDKSGEILLKNNIEDQFIRYNSETLKSIKLHSEFTVYFNNVYQKEDLSKYKPETISVILQDLEGVISSSTMKRYWEKFSNDVQSKENGGFKKLKDWHKSIFLNASEKSSKTLADRIASSSKQEFDNSNNSEDSDGSDYFWTLFELVSYLNDNSIKAKAEIEKVTFTPGQFLYYIDDVINSLKEGKCTYKDLKINVDSKALNKYLIEHPDGISHSYSYLHVIDFLIKEDKTYKPKELKEHIEKRLQEISHSSVEEIKQLLEILKLLSGKKKIKLIPKNTGTNFLNSYGSKQEAPYFDLVANQIAHLTPNQNPSSSYFQNELNRDNNAEDIASRVQYYTTLGDILKLIVQSNQSYPLLVEIVKILIKKSFGFTRSLDVKWIFENIRSIEDEVFSEGMDEFLNRFNDWSHHYSKFVKEENIFDFGEDIIDFAVEKDNHKFYCVKHYYNVVISKLKNASKEDWLENFNSESNFSYAFSNLLQNELLDKSITKGNEFMEAYEDYLKGIAKRENNIPNDKTTWETLENGYLDNRKQKRLFNDFLDLLLGHTEINADEIKFFSSGLFSFSSNLYDDKRKAEEYVRKVIIPSKNNEDTFKYLFENYREEVIKVINSTGEYKLDLFELFHSAKENEIIDDEEYRKIIEKTNLTKMEKSLEETKKEVGT